MHTITFDGIKTVNNISYLAFKNDFGKRIEIPIDKKLGTHIMLYLQKILPPEITPVERGNEEDSDLA